MALAAVGGRGGAPDEQARGLGLDRDVGEQLLHELEARDRAAELRALLRVGDRRVEAALRDADAAGAERDAAVVERRHRDLEAGAELAEPVGVGDADAVEEELGGVLRAQAELALDRPRLEARRVGRDDEARDPARARLAGAREDERVRRPGAERDEDLLAAQHPVVAVALGARLEPARVGAGARLGQRVAAELLAGARARGGGAPSARRCPSVRRTCRRGRSRPRRCRARSSRRGRSPRRRARTRPCRAPCRRAPRAAPRRGSRARRACRRSTRSIASVAVPLGRVRRDLRVAELARGLADQLLLVREREVHADDLTSGGPPTQRIVAVGATCGHSVTPP